MKTKQIIALVLSMVMTIGLLAGCGEKENEATTTENNNTEQTEQVESNPEVGSVQWKFGHMTNEDHVWNKTAEKFAELVSEKTEGVIEITIYPNEQLGSEVDVLNMIQTKTADITIAGESMANWAPKAALMAVPYAFKSLDQMVTVINNDIGEEIATEIEENLNVVPIYYHLRAPRNLTSNEPIRTPEDAKGLKMRVPSVPLFLDVWQAVGAQPQVMAFGEVFTGLQQGVISGQENPYDLIYSAGFYEVQKYVNETEHVNQWVYIVLGKEQLESLSPELQAAVLEAAEEAGEYGNELFENEIADYKQKVQDEGMIIISDVDKDAFQKAMEPAVKESLSEEQFELYQRMIQQ
jgi:tripartite ATP-independent transporter DctP family solute receptor